MTTTFGHHNSCVLFIAFAFAFGTLAAAQAGSAQSAAQQPAPSSVPPAAQLKLPVPLVVEDIVALDHDGQPVQGLKASDLKITEDGKPVTLRVFEEHTPATRPASVPKFPYLGPDVFTNVQPAPENGSLYVLLLDALNTPVTDQAYVRQQMLKYLKTLPPGMRVAVFGLGTRLYFLQGFTSNPEILEAAISAKHSKGVSPLLDDPVSGEPVEQMSDTMQDSMNMDDPASQLIVANMQQFEAETATTVTRIRMIYTLQAMDDLARYLSAFPGRKNLIWFSGSFPLDIFPDEDLPNPFGAMADFQDDVRKTTDLLARSRVAVYPVDGRGLMVNPMLSASQSGASLVRQSRTNPAAFAKADQKFQTQNSSEHATMEMMAEATGGKAFYNTNGLKEAVEKIAGYGDNFYTIAYTPQDQKLDGSYRRISIKADQPGLHLDYRKGYFADDPNTAAHGEKVLPQSAMSVAMMRGGPDAAQILFDVAVIPADTPGDTITKGTRPNPKLMQPPYTSYTAQYLVDISSAAFTATDKGRQHGQLEFAAVVYDADGEVVNSTDNAVTLELTPDKYADMLKHGLMARQIIEAPVKGEYFLRVGVHDVPGDHIGAIEVPLTGLKTRKQLTDEAAKQAHSAAK